MLSARMTFLPRCSFCCSSQHCRCCFSCGYCVVTVAVFVFRVVVRDVLTAVPVLDVVVMDLVYLLVMEVLVLGGFLNVIRVVNDRLYR